MHFFLILSFITERKKCLDRNLGNLNLEIFPNSFRILFNFELLHMYMIVNSLFLLFLTFLFITFFIEKYGLQIFYVQ